MPRVQLGFVAMHHAADPVGFGCIPIKPLPNGHGHTHALVRFKGCSVRIFLGNGAGHDNDRVRSLRCRKGGTKVSVVILHEEKGHLAAVPEALEGLA